MWTPFLKENPRRARVRLYYGGETRRGGSKSCRFLTGQFGETTMASKWHIFEETIKEDIGESGIRNTKPAATPVTPVAIH